MSCQRVINVIAMATTAVTALHLGNVLINRGPDKAMKEQMLMNRQLDYDIARLKHCGELRKFGIQFHPESTMQYLCADVVVTP
mgnify:FL=1